MRLLGHRSRIGILPLAAVVVLVGGACTERPEAASESTPPQATTTTPPPTVGSTVGEQTLPLELQTVTAAWETNFAVAAVPLDELHVGIPASDPRDRIPPIDRPRFESIEDADGWIGDREPGVLLSVDAVVRFYPLSILTRHEIVNDEIDGTPVVVTYCPLCNSAVAFDPRVDGEVLRFGVSGLLRQSDLVMWDRQTESLWQQITGEAIVGDLTGTRLATIPTSLVAWADFVASHPSGEVLAFDQGFGIEYGLNPYVGYSSSDGPISGFFDGEADDRFPALSRVVSVAIDDDIVAYPFESLETARVVNDTVGGSPITVWWGSPETADALDASVIASAQAIGTGVAYLSTVDGELLEFEALDDGRFRDTSSGSIWSILGSAVDGPLTGTQLEVAPHRNEFWFAFAAFHPDADVWTP